MSGVTKLDRIRNEIIIGFESGRNIQESAGKWVEVVRAVIEKKRIDRRDRDCGAGKKKERKTKTKVVG